MSNNLATLNTHLFDQLDRLNNTDLAGEELQAEINRAEAVVGVSKEVISNGNLRLNALKLQAEYHGIGKEAVTNAVGLESK